MRCPKCQYQNIDKRREGYDDTIKLRCRRCGTEWSMNERDLY